MHAGMRRGTSISRGLPGPLGRVGAKELHLWLGAWLEDRARKAIAPAPVGTKHVLFALCNHFEPLHGEVDLDRGLARVAAWSSRYPEICTRFRDADGRPPRHSFFYPGEQYDSRLLEPIGEMVEAGLGEVEVHLHHDGDTRDSLRVSLARALADFDEHGLVPKTNGRARVVSSSTATGASRTGGATGDGAAWTTRCDLLFNLGCYADFTFPSAPDESQPGVVNCIYYPRGDVTKQRAYESAEPVRVGTPKRDRLLLVEGPLAMALRPGTLTPRIESAALDHGDPPTEPRLRTSIDQRVTVRGRPEWIFVKVHTHGAPEKNAGVMLGEPITRFHEALARTCNDGRESEAPLRHGARDVQRGARGDGREARRSERVARLRGAAAGARADSRRRGDRHGQDGLPTVTSFPSRRE